MGRIEKRFRDLKKLGEKALCIFVTAGDPDLKTTEKLIIAFDQAGADIIEVGVPFSDPTADGPIIQAASQRALNAGTTLSGVLDMIERVRTRSDIPIVLFGYYNLILSFGNEKFADRARKAGVDGVLCVDLPFEEAPELKKYTDKAGIDFISLIAPTTDPQRIARIAGQAQGFLYYISITGITGTAKPIAANIRKDVSRIRVLTKLPILAGFGIYTPEQAAQIGPMADGIVVGSAVVRMIAENAHRTDMVEYVAAFVESLKKAI